MGATADARSSVPLNKFTGVVENGGWVQTMTEPLRPHSIGFYCAHSSNKRDRRKYSGAV